MQFARSSSEGLTILHAADKGMRVVKVAEDAAMIQEWEGRGFHLLHGRYGYGHLGLPLPWGVSAGIDAYLEGNGLSRPA